jgi:hypothetical protein
MGLVWLGWVEIAKCGFVLRILVDNMTKCGELCNYQIIPIELCL